MLKVAFFTHYSSLYGANRSLLNLIDGLMKYDVLPYIICPNEGEITEALHNRGVPVEILPIQQWVGEKPVPTKNFLKYVNRIIRSRHQVFLRLYTNFRLLNFLSKKLHSQEIDIVYTNSSVISIGMLVAKQLKIPHVWHLREFGDLDYGLYPDWGIYIQKQVLHLSDKFIAVSEAIRNHLVEDVDKERVHVIYNGVASETEFNRLYSINQRKADTRQYYTFAILGFIHSGKGQDVAIKALSLVVKKFPETRLLIIGSGNTQYLQQLVKDLSLEGNIEFWGYVSDPYQAYLACDAVLMCSQNEGMGRVTVEAMSACRPVIGYSNAGTLELIEHEHNGLLYQGNHEELATCMLRLVDDPDWGYQMGINAWHFAQPRFTVEFYAQAVYKVLSVLTKKSAA